MGRWEFMRKLEELLSDISPSEREEALQYYNDYFNDAGRENEKEVIQALGSPEEVAEIVRSGLMDDPDKGEFTENGFASQQKAVRQNEIIQSEKVEGRRKRKGWASDLGDRADRDCLCCFITGYSWNRRWGIRCTGWYYCRDLWYCDRYCGSHGGFICSSCWSCSVWNCCPF